MLAKAGFLESVTKFQPPTQRGEFLGLISDLVRFKFLVPEPKLASIIAKIKELICVKLVPVRVVVSVYGRISACRLAYGPMLRLKTRTGQKFYSAEGMRDWEGWMNVAPFKAELRELLSFLPNQNGFPFFGLETPVKVDCVHASDASAVGYGVVRVVYGRSHLSTFNVCWTRFSEWNQNSFDLGRNTLKFCICKNVDWKLVSI